MTISLSSYAGGGLNQAAVDARVVAVAGNSLNAQTVFTSNVLDNAVYVFDFGGNVFSGTMIIGCGSSGTRGLFAIRTVATAFCTAISATGITGTTGALTGTTGADGTVTVATHTDNKLYVENRLGFTTNFTITLNFVDFPP